jgi:hypothetical protein
MIKKKARKANESNCTGRSLSKDSQKKARRRPGF